MNKKTKARVGDMFSISLSNSTHACGQVVENLGDLLYIVVFAKQIESEFDISSLVRQRIALASVTTDAKIWHDHWPVIGNYTSNISDIARPFFKVHFFKEDKYYIEPLRKGALVPATPEEIALYHNRFSVSPKRLENAAIAYFGLAEWQPKFDKLRYDEVQKRSRFRRGNKLI